MNVMAIFRLNPPTLCNALQFLHILYVHVCVHECVLMFRECVHECVLMFRVCVCVWEGGLSQLSYSET